MEQVDEIIIRIVDEHPGIKGTDLISQLIHKHIKAEIDLKESNNLLKRMYDLAYERRIVEVEYILPETDRVKSLFFPGGTKINLRIYE